MRKSRRRRIQRNPTAAAETISQSVAMTACATEFAVGIGQFLGDVCRGAFRIGLSSQPLRRFQCRCNGFWIRFRSAQFRFQFPIQLFHFGNARASTSSFYRFFVFIERMVHRSPASAAILA